MSLNYNLNRAIFKFELINPPKPDKETGFHNHKNHSDFTGDKTLTSHWCSVQCTEYDGHHILSGLCLYSKQSVSLLSDKEINIHSREIVY